MLPKMELPELGETSTDYESTSSSSSYHPSSSTPSTPIYPENPRNSWGHQRSWSTSILGYDKPKNFVLNSNDNKLNPDSAA